MSARAFALAAAALAALASCSFDAGSNAAFGCDESCVPGACHLGYCLMRLDDARGTSPPASSAGADGAGTLGGGGGSDPSAAAGVGAAGIGSAGADAAGTGAEVAGDGGDPACTLGTPAQESCNGLDDDCNGVVDDLPDAPCYPSGLAGCKQDAQGNPQCVGACAAGTRSCVAGELGACEGYVGPAVEQCGGAQAIDESCDGRIDDGCPCSGSATQRCYGGPLFTAGIGACRAGTQQCQAGTLGDCEGEIVPSAETCDNQGSDDDCDLLVDDVPGRGLSCTDLTKSGVCRSGTRQCENGSLVCVTPEPLADESACDGRDEDCDGEVDEKYDLTADAQNCGACGKKCTLGQACCGGACVATDTREHCGGCGGCGTDQACCDGACVATDTFVHCGGCGGCAGGQACCERTCVGIDSVDHCGGCGGCAPEQACCDRECIGPSGDAGVTCL